MKQRRGQSLKGAQGLARVRQVDVAALHAIVEKAKSGPLSSDDVELLGGAVDTLAFITEELEAKGASLSRLRNLLFGGSSEKADKVLADDANAPKKDQSMRKAANPDAQATSGHGRNAASSYKAATRIEVPHESIRKGDRCPLCARGNVNGMREPAQLVRVQGMAPIAATIYACDRLRCSTCGEVFTAKAPAGVGDEKYDASATAMVGMLRYGAGVPFNRIERLQKSMGIPLPASTQWDLVNLAEEKLEAAHDELIRQAACGQVVHNDDTSMPVLELMEQSREEALAAGEDEELAGRSGIRTTGIVSTTKEHKVALFFTGRRHAGENLETVLMERSAKMPPPIQMCDALAANADGQFKAILSSCLTHARRYFVDVANDFPDEVRHVIETLRDVYGHEATVRKQEMADNDRLAFHRDKSAPLMNDLKAWMRAQLDEHRVEPNSGLGEAMRHMLKHWEKLTLFLRVPGAPLDNNICERALKKAILHRRNSLFYKTLRGARVGDVFMSIIHTAELNRVDPFAYLTALLRHADDVRLDPSAWMPWNYPRTAE